ncbi:MAG: DUF5309 family protein, partial [Rhodothermales bacterium]|nr:DUF5309 family protein [Rhodothermales bacterium]
MAAITGTSSSYSVGSGGGNREDLADVIYDLFADETFLTSNLDRAGASSTLTEWLGDTLASAASNINIEGDDATFSTIANPSRFGNYTQIVRKTFLVSGTQEVVNKAGRRSEISRQAMKQMREAKNDFEWALVRNQAGTAGGTATGRALASVETWIGEATTSGGSTAANVVRATTTASATTPAVTSGVPGTAPTDGSTTGALTAGSLDAALQGAWEDGGNTDVILVSASVKNTINTFSGVAQRNVDVGRRQQAVITGAADMYVSNYGVHRIVLHRHARTSVALCLDLDLWSIGVLRDWRLEKLAKTGDGEKRQ